MPTNQLTPGQPTNSGTSVSVSVDAAARLLDGILRKPNARRGKTSAYVTNKRKVLGTPKCKASAVVFACLADNGCVEELCSALRTLLNPGDVRAGEPIAEIARHVTRAEREIAEPIEELFANRASSRDYATITREAHTLELEAEQLESAAARALYVEPIRRAS